MSMHTQPYEFTSMVDFADHMEEEHGLDHSTAYDRDRWQLQELHILAHFQSARHEAIELRSQLEEALGIINDLHRPYVGVYTPEIQERIAVLRLKQ